MDCYLEIGGPKASPFVLGLSLSINPNTLPSGHPVHQTTPDKDNFILMCQIITASCTIWRLYNLGLTTPTYFDNYFDLILNFAFRITEAYWQCLSCSTKQHKPKKTDKLRYHRWSTEKHTLSHPLALKKYKLISCATILCQMLSSCSFTALRVLCGSDSSFKGCGCFSAKFEPNWTKTYLQSNLLKLIIH